MEGQFYQSGVPKCSLGESRELCAHTHTEYRLTPPLTLSGEDLDVDGDLATLQCKLPRHARFVA